MESLSDAVAASSSPESSPESTVSAASSAETQTTGSAASEEQPPFHTHPRWQEVQSNLKTYKQRVADLELSAQYGKTWQEALASHPALAKHIETFIQQQGQAPQGQPTIDPMQSMQQEVQQIKHQTLLGQHVQHFGRHMQDLDVSDKMKPHVEEAVWKMYRQIDPQAMQPNGYLTKYNPQAFEQAVEAVKQIFQEDRQATIDKYTQKKLKDAPPSVNQGGSTPKSTPSRSHKDEMSDFVRQLKSVSGQ